MRKFAYTVVSVVDYSDGLGGSHPVSRRLFAENPQVAKMRVVEDFANSEGGEEGTIAVVVVIKGWPKLY